MLDTLPLCWRSVLAEFEETDTFQTLMDFVCTERQEAAVFPAEFETLNALRMTPLQSVKAVILGQDPYHGEGQAHGLSFSVREGTSLPPSLKNIFKELETDLGIAPANCGDLSSWAQQGVLLLNTVLTVRAHQANSHRKRGWEEFTDLILKSVNQRQFVVFILWGKPAQQKMKLIDERHRIIASAHPSPLSAHRGFFGSRPFSSCNAALNEAGVASIDWQLPVSKTP